MSANKRNLFGACIIVFSLLSISGLRAEDNDINCPRTGDKFCFVKETGLPLRLLVKPQSNVYLQMDEKSAQVSSNVPAFSVLFAFDMIDVGYDNNNFAASGWFKVGFSTKGPEGYMRAEDVVMWRQALALAFTNPGPSERKPVLMFASHEALDGTLEDIENGKTSANKLYELVSSGAPPDSIVSREGNAWVDIDEKFYLLPILKHEDLTFFNPEGLLGIQLAALTNKGRTEQKAACDIHEAGADQCLKDQAGGGVSGVALDVVFVIDMTRSMQPYIDAVASAIREATQALAQKLPNQDALKFGLVGYRDDLSVSPGLEFVSKNFTPELLGGDAFRQFLDSGTVVASEEGSEDDQEEVFAGVRSGIASNWSPKAARVIIVIGDSSSHDVGHPKNTTGMSARAVKELSDQENVYIASLYVGETDADDIAQVRQQYTTMSAGEEATDAAFSMVGSGGDASVQKSLKDTISRIVDFLSQGRFESISSATGDQSDTASRAVLGAVRAAFVDYIGSSATPPSNITAWALDRDPTDFKKRAFDVKVMVQRKELQELMALLDKLLHNFRESKATSASFFDAVQSAGTAMSYDLGIAETDKFMGTDVVPRWIKSLPYKSEVLTLSLEEFRQSAPEDRTRFEERLQQLIKLYDDTLNRPDAWVALNDQSTAEDKVYMLDLQNLP